MRGLAVFAIACTLMCLPLVSSGQECKGRFLNPLSDLCWSCMFPMKVGNATIRANGQETFDTDARALCMCGNGANITVGLNLQFFEPLRLFEAVRQPGCFPALGGMKIDLGIDAPAHGRTPKAPADRRGRGSTVSFYQAHWYQAPWLFVLEAILDTRCLEQSPFDMAYLSEFDPLWADSEETFVLNPDAALFTNVASSAACAADCVQSSVDVGNHLLWWCAGCQGRLFPLSGWVTEHVGGVQAAALLMQRFTAKLHREGLMWAAYGEEGQCGYYLQPLMDKRAYKYHMVWPARSTEKYDGKCCYPYGRTTMFWQAGKEFPIGGEDFVMQIWRRRDCCQGASFP